MRSNWAADAGGVVTSVGREDFGRTLDALVRTVAAFDMSCIFAFHRHQGARLVYDGYSENTSADVLNSYIKGGYLLDPFYAAPISGIAEGLYRMSQIAPDDFFDSDFAHSPHVHPCISAGPGSVVEEIGYVVDLPHGWRAVYSLMRGKGRDPFSDASVEALAELTPFIASCVRRHVEVAESGLGVLGSQKVDTALEKAFSKDLTGAQFKVVNLALRGHSNASIARTLGIVEGTVKIHRSHAYERLGISSQSELFNLFLDYLATSQDAAGEH